MAQKDAVLRADGDLAKGLESAVRALDFMGRIAQHKIGSDVAGYCRKKRDELMNLWTAYGKPEDIHRFLEEEGHL